MFGETSLAFNNLSAGGVEYFPRNSLITTYFLFGYLLSESDSFVKNKK